MSLGLTNTFCFNAAQNCLKQKQNQKQKAIKNPQNAMKTCGCWESTRIPSSHCKLDYKNILKAHSPWHKSFNSHGKHLKHRIIPLLLNHNRDPEDSTASGWKLCNRINIFNTPHSYTICSHRSKGTYVPLCYSTWPLNIALIEFPNYLTFNMHLEILKEKEGILWRGKQIQKLWNFMQVLEKSDHLSV